MFCKKCGKELIPEAKFCPVCGQKVENEPVESQVEPQAMLADQAEPHSKAESVPQSKPQSKTTAKSQPARHRKVWLYALPAVAIVLVVAIVFSSIQIVGVLKSFQKPSQAYTDSPYGFNRSDYQDLNFSLKQINELESTYNTAYEDEAAALDDYILAYAANYGKPDFSFLLGTTETFAQAINDYAPDLRDELAELAGEKLGEGEFSSAMIEGGVQLIFSDSDIGRDIRSIIDLAMIGSLEFLMSFDTKDPIRADAMMPIDVCGNYALVKSHGNIGSIMNELAFNSGYTIVSKALEERFNTLKELNAEEVSIDDYWSEDPNVVFEAYRKSSNYEARQQAILTKLNEWNESLIEWNTEFLERIGIDNIDPAVNVLHLGPENSNNTSSVSSNETADTSGNNMLGCCLYSVIDQDGNVIHSYLLGNGELNGRVNADGSCSIWQNDYHEFSSSDELSEEYFPMISMNANGEVVFENSNEKADSLYYPLTASGNALRRNFTTNAQWGTYQVIEWVQPGGNAVKLMEGNDIVIEETSYKDYYRYSCGYKGDPNTQTHGYIEMTSGKLITKDEYEQIVQTQSLARLFKNPQQEKFDITWSNGYQVNDQYSFYNDTLRDRNGNTVIELKNGGGVKDIFYGDGKYWIVAQTGQYYVLDENLNEILPMTMLQYSFCSVTPYGILCMYTDEETRESYLYLYDETGTPQPVNDVPLNSKTTSVETQGFLAWGEGFFFDLSEGAINLKTRQPLFLTTMEKPVDLTQKISE